MKRLFIAIKIISDAELLKVYNDIRKHCYADKIKWVDTGLFHLTLKFFGETPEEDISTISDVLEEVAGSTQSFTFDLNGIGIFGSSYRPRIIRVKIDNDKRLIELGNDVLRRLEKAGFRSDRQNFVPHLTLGRIKFIQNKNLFQNIIQKYQSVFFQEVAVEELILYESVLHFAGPEYFVLKKYKLA